MELRELDKKELAELYESELTVDFPRAELKPLKAMLRLMDMGRYDPLLVEEDGQPVGYALVWLPEEQRGGLLEYLGVLRGKRNDGLGTKILTLLMERYGQIFGEAEAPCSDDPAENDLRRRRLGFYQRNGFRVLDYECALFGVRFNCLYQGPETDDRKVQALHRSVYAGYFSEKHMERYIQIPLAPGEEPNPAPEWVEEEYPESRLTLKKVTDQERQTLWNIFQKFLYEMTNYYDDVMDSEGNYAYSYFDRYFDEEGREALFLLDDGALVGFAMLNTCSYLGETPDHVLAEFTIFPMYRRNHLGLEAAQVIFSRYPGRWEVKYNEKNTAAKALWTRAAEQYAPRAVKYSEVETVLCFETESEP